MSYGNCCVASDIPENLEAIEDFGFIFKNRDSNDLQRVLARLIANPGIVESKKQPARDHVLSNYSWDTIADQMEQLYFEILKN